jgi:phospholipid/cholesterol/gamma-HCH transport system ATP-binding protein
MSSIGNEKEVLSCDRIQFTYHGALKPVIKDLTLKLCRSEVVILIGPGGQGKTTLLKILSGLLKPQTGEVSVQGASLSQISKRDRQWVLSRIAMTFQRNGLFDSMTVLENLLFPLRELKSLSLQESLNLIQKVLAQVQIVGSESKFPHEISGGMQKRLGIARALILQPEAILYDDPTAGLDPITSNHIMDLILQVHREKRTATLISTSDLDLAVRVSQQQGAKIAFLYQGNLLGSWSAQELLDSTQPVIYQFVRGLADGPLAMRDYE